MRNRPTDSFCSTSSLAVILACVSISPSLSAQVADSNAALQNPQFRQALQRLIKKYQQAEQHTAGVTQSSASDAASTTPTSSLADNSQTFDSTIQDAAVSEELVEGSRFAEGEELILGVEIASKNSTTALSDVFAFKTNTSAQLGFTTFIQLLELPIEVSSDLKRANGWIYNENNKFSYQLDAAQRLAVSVNGKNWELTEENYRIESDDIYIDLDLIAQWFGFKFDIDESRLKLTLTTERQLPVELRIARRNRQVTTTSYSNASVMPYRETGYSAFSPPLFDAQISTSRRSDETSVNYSVVGAHDFAWLTTNYYLSGSKDDALGSARITFARESATNDLLGPLKATEFEFGDVLPVGNTVGASRNLGRGLRFSNTPLVSSIDGRKVTLTGDMRDGWDVELYRNGILLDQKFAVSDGRYEFNDIELEFGENSFELVFYGPQGQVETKTEVFNIDNNSVGKGQFNYQFSAVEANKSVFGLEENNYAASAKNQGPQTNVAVGYGVSDWLSLTGGAGLFKPDLGEEQQSYNLGVNTNLFGVALLSSTTEEVKDYVRSANHSLRTKVFDTAFSFSYLDRTPLGVERLSNDVASDSYNATMSGRLFGSSALALNYQNEWRKDNNVTDIIEVYRNSLGVSSSLGSLSHSLELRKRTELLPLQSLPVSTDSFADPMYLQQLLSRLAQESEQQPLAERNVLPETLSGGLQFRKSFNSVFTRLFASYSVKPESELLSYGASFSYPFTPDLTSNLSVFRYPKADQVAANLGLNWRLDDVYLSASASYNNINGWSGGLNARFGFGYNDNAGYFASNSSVSQTGAVSARVFEDKNLNGTLDENERLIKDTKVKALQGGQRSVVTDSKGIAVITGLAPNLKTDIVVDRASFEDPSMKTLLPGVALTGRKGYIEHIDFPVSATGELEGTLYLSSEEGQMEPAAFAGIQLIDANGKVVDTTQSEYDGYYLFVDIVPGQYKILIDKSFTKRRNLRLSDPVYLAVRGGQVINGSDIMLKNKDLASGYAAEMGRFTSLPVLKAYWGLLVRSGMNVAKFRPFYLHDEESGRYVLRAGFYKDKQSATDVCDRIKGRKLKCTVNEFETKL